MLLQFRMFARFCFAGVMTAITCCTSPSGATRLVVGDLRCEYLVDPLGIDAVHPRLSWELSSNGRGKRQTAYRILVAEDSLSLSVEKAAVWDSRKTFSDATYGIAYAGTPLKSRQFYYWKVQAWDEQDQRGDWSPIARFSMGLEAKDWTAQWIGARPEAVPLKDHYYNHRGYQSGVSDRADTKKEVIIDLGNITGVEAIRLYPAMPPGQTKGSYLFPVRFRVDLSTDANFATITTPVNETGDDDASRKGIPYTKKFPSQPARYVKITVTQLAPMPEKGFAFALAEIEVIRDGMNRALHKPVRVSDTNRMGFWASDNWEKERLTDGFLKPNDNPPFSLPVTPSPLLRRSFNVTKKIQKAMLYITALGLYEARINGDKVGHQLLAPEFTDYRTRVQYQTYDITRMLRRNENVIGVTLADGWYAGAIFSHPDRGTYGFDRRLLAQLEMMYTDGTRETVNTDDHWEVLSNGPLRRASLYDGEEYDARLEPTGWDKPGYAPPAKLWEKVSIDTSIHKTLSAQMNEPIKVVMERHPVKVFEPRKGVYIFDMGQNMVGWCKLSLPYNPKHVITLRHAEVLKDDSTLYVDNLRAAKQTDRYMPAGETRVRFEPRFTYHGFRYVEVTGLTERPDRGVITGMVVASAVASTGEIECSDAALNQLASNIVWTQRGNLHSVPTDCPQRDERAGWMGDAQVFSQTAIYNMDMAAFFTKWIRDIRDSQTPDGRFPDFAPQPGHWMSFYNSPGWGDAGVIVPWRLYENYGDTTVLARQFDAMKRYIDLIRAENPDLIWRNVVGNPYGDWLNGDNIIGSDYPKAGGAVPREVYATAFFAYSTRLLANAAHVLGKKEDAERYESLAEAIRKSFQNKFVSSNGEVKGNTQAGYALALEFDLIHEELRPASAALMVKAIEAYDYRISTGIQSTIRLMNQLSKNGYAPVAYRLLQSHRFPSWLYSVDQGATTIWERWDGYVKGRGFQDKGMNSFNHYAIGAVGEWMYRNILGIQPDPESSGYKHFFIAPQIGGGLTYAKGMYHSIAGTIAVRWEKTNSKFFMDVDIPVNTSATVMLPKGMVQEGGKPIKTVEGIVLVKEDETNVHYTVPSGHYRFSVMH